MELMRVKCSGETFARGMSPIAADSFTHMSQLIATGKIMSQNLAKDKAEKSYYIMACYKFFKFATSHLTREPSFHWSFNLIGQ